jgi:hypothetical protein
MLTRSEGGIFTFRLSCICWNHLNIFKNVSFLYRNSSGMDNTKFDEKPASWPNWILHYVRSKRKRFSSIFGNFMVTSGCFRGSTTADELRF